MTALANPAAFFAAVRTGNLLGAQLTNTEVQGVNALLDACGLCRWPIAYIAYALATAWHETAHTMQPIAELGGDEYFRRNYDITGRDPERARKLGNTTPGDGIRYRGRGFVQLTWKLNYANAGAALGLPLVEQPDMALYNDIAARVLVWGMLTGSFTHISLPATLPAHGPATSQQFVEARKVINGTDRAAEIAHAAIEFQDALSAGGWA